MFYLIVNSLRPWLEQGSFRFLRVFTFREFQATAAVLVSFLLALFLGPKVIRWLREQKIGDNPDFDEAEMNKTMADKSGTPTMGGVLILFSIAFTVLLLADLQNFYVQMALVCLIWLGGVGMVDDWLKLTAKRRGGGRQGLTSYEKLIFQVGLSVVLSIFTYRYGRAIPESHQYYVPFFKNFTIDLGLVGFVIISTIVMTGSSNAVNLTDGLDGLAAGCMAIVSFVFLIMALIVGDSDMARTLFFPYIKASDQMAVVAAAVLGACLGFLWFNCNPARVFMGDTGSLALGGVIAYIAIVVRQELLLFIAGGIFVAEALSVMIQVSYFKYTRKRYGTGRRIFLMSPLHHHFQKKGWPETQVVVRFWLIGAMLAAMAIATVKLR